MRRIFCDICGTEVPEGESRVVEPGSVLEMACPGVRDLCGACMAAGQGLDLESVVLSTWREAAGVKPKRKAAGPPSAGRRGGRRKAGSQDVRDGTGPAPAETQADAVTEDPPKRRGRPRRLHTDGGDGTDGPAGSDAMAVRAGPVESDVPPGPDEPAGPDVLPVRDEPAGPDVPAVRDEPAGSDAPREPEGRSGQDGPAGPDVSVPAGDGAPAGAASKRAQDGPAARAGQSNAPGMDARGAADKSRIFRELVKYRAERGVGSLQALSEKTGISADALREALLAKKYDLAWWRTVESGLAAVGWNVGKPSW